jgi:hypothetical protein
MRIDQHGVRHLPEGIDPARNLQVQSAIVARAERFVGTYGGFSYLAPFYGVESHAYYSNEEGYSPRHLNLAYEAFERCGSRGRLHVHPTSECGLD